MKCSRVAIWGLTAAILLPGAQPAAAIPEKSDRFDKAESPVQFLTPLDIATERSPGRVAPLFTDQGSLAAPVVTATDTGALRQPVSIELSQTTTPVATDWSGIEAAIAPATEARELAVVQIVEPHTGQAWHPADSASELFTDSSTLAQGIPSQPSNTSNTGWYVALTPALVFGYDVDIGSEEIAVAVSPAPGLPPIGTTNVSVDASLDTDTGFGISGAFGYRFDDARVELEIGYLSNSVDSVTVNDFEASADGDIDNWQFLVNGYYDIPTNSRFTPYVGGGIGLAILSANDVSATAPALGELDIDDSSASFLFQVKGGVGYDITDDFNAFFGYRLLGLPGQSFEVFDTDFDADTIFIHSLQLGARYEF